MVAVDSKFPASAADKQIDSRKRTRTGRIKQDAPTPLTPTEDQPSSETAVTFKEPKKPRVRKVLVTDKEKMLDIMNAVVSKTEARFSSMVDLNQRRETARVKREAKTKRRKEQQKDALVENFKMNAAEKRKELRKAQFAVPITGANNMPLPNAKKVKKKKSVKIADDDSD